MDTIILNHKIADSLLIEKTCQILKKGGLVVIPSDTVYGLAADATNKDAIKKLIEFKKRPPGKAISVFVKDLKQTEQLVTINQSQRGVLEQILPGPFTVVLPSKHILVKELESEKGTLGIRLPRFDFINNLAQTFGIPITATSANISGRSYHYSIESFLRTLSHKKKGLLDLIVDFGKLPKNKPSTVIDLSERRLKIIRYGDLNLKTTQKFISETPDQTKKIAQFLLNKYIYYVDKKPLIFLIEGELGVGKTVFIKGIGEELGIDNIISPSFVIYYEYEIKSSKFKIPTCHRLAAKQLAGRQSSKLFHIDLYMIEQAEEFDYLHIERMLKPRTIICVEWGEKIETVYDLLRGKGKIVYIKLKYITEKEREIKISN